MTWGEGGGSARPLKKVTSFKYSPLLSVSNCGIDSVEANAFINAKFESKTLTLNSDKCHKLHIGLKQKTCPQLHAHDEDMELVVQDKYLGDYITTDGKHDKTISARCSSGTGQTSALMTISRLCSTIQRPAAVLW